MDKKALATEECMGSRPGGETSPTVVSFQSGAVEEIEATVLACEDGGKRGFTGILRGGMESFKLQAGKRLDQEVCTDL